MVIKEISHVETTAATTEQIICLVVCFIDLFVFYACIKAEVRHLRNIDNTWNIVQFGNTCGFQLCFLKTLLKFSFGEICMHKILKKKNNNKVFAQMT